MITTLEGTLRLTPPLLLSQRKIVVRTNGTFYLVLRLFFLLSSPYSFHSGSDYRKVGTPLLSIPGKIEVKRFATTRHRSSGTSRRVNQVDCRAAPVQRKKKIKRYYRHLSSTLESLYWSLIACKGLILPADRANSFGGDRMLANPA